MYDTLNAEASRRINDTCAWTPNKLMCLFVYLDEVPKRGGKAPRKKQKNGQGRMTTIERTLRKKETTPSTRLL